jgi:hypothetical protein
MQITFEVPVVMKARPGRAINERTVFGYVPIILDVPVLDTADAPVVLEYDADRDSGITVHEKFRGYEGRFYHDIRATLSDRMSLGISRHRQPDGLFDAQRERIQAVASKIVADAGKDFANLAATKMYPESFVDFQRHQRFEVALEPISGMDLKGDFSETVDEQVAAFARHASRLVIVDGRFHLPEAEPLISVKPGFAGDVRTVAVRESERMVPGTLVGHGRDMETLGYFRFDDLERLHEEMTAMAAGNRVMTSVHDIRVHDESLFEVNADALTLAELGAVFRNHFAASLAGSLLAEEENGVREIAEFAGDLRRMPIEQLALYQRLCDGIDAVNANGETSSLEDAISRIVESPRGSPERRFFVFSGNVARLAQRIMERWNDRTVEVGTPAAPVSKIG